MPYAGNSSEWKTPFTPANFAAPASSLPSLGNWAPSASTVFVPIFPANPGNGKASIVKDWAKPLAIIFD